MAHLFAISKYVRFHLRSYFLHFFLQIIVSGDFKQLPPVPNYRYGDTGNYCFQCPDYNRVLPHRINLTEVRTKS